jgi:alkylation response protein AidB-like acyl-CoA dehydrogenase
LNAYSAPLEDMRFVLRHLVEMEKLAQLPDSEVLGDPELTRAILEQAGRFASEVLWPLDRAGDLEGARWTDAGVLTTPGFKLAYGQYVEAGWNNVAMPAEFGGQDLPPVLCSAIHEMFTAANKAFSMCPNLVPEAIRALMAAASEPMKSFYIPKLVSGEWTATMNLTEPQAGSDVGALRTRADLQPDGSYRLYGQKIFISFGDHDLTTNIVHLVLARIAGAPDGSRGISLFVVPKVLADGRRNDVQCTGIEHKLGNHGSPTCSMSYGARGEGAVGWLVGHENRGLQAMFVMMNGARLNVGLEAVGVGDRAYQQALNYARERIQGRLATGGDPVAIIRHPDVRRMLLSMRSQLEAMRATAYHIAAARQFAERHPDTEERRTRQAFLDLAIPVFKGWATETGIEVASTSIQVFGGAGYVEDHGASQPLRDVRVTSIYEGTTAIQAEDLVERKIVRDGGAAFNAWMASVQATAQQLAGSGNAGLCDIARRLNVGSAALARAVEQVLADYGHRPLVVLAGSVPLLRSFGVVLGGWHMARAALVAQRHLEVAQGHTQFMLAKVASARYYATNILPQAIAYANVAREGGASVMEMEEAAF